MIEHMLFDPESEHHYRQGTEFFEENLLWQAIQQYQQAITIDPSHYLAWLNMGVAYGKLGELEDAKRCFDRAAELNDVEQIDDELLLDNMGMVYLALGDAVKAVTFFRLAAAIDEDDEQIQRNLKLALSKLDHAIKVTSPPTEKTLE